MIATLDRMIKWGLSEEIIFNLKTECNTGANHLELKLEGFLREENYYLYIQIFLSQSSNFIFLMPLDFSTMTSNITTILYYLLSFFVAFELHLKTV